MLATRLASSLHKHVDSAVQAAGVQVRTRDVKDRRRVEVWVVAAVLGILAVSGLAIALGSSSSGVPAKVAVGRHLVIAPASPARSLGGARAISRSRQHPSTRSSDSASQAASGTSSSASANAHPSGSENSRSAAQLQAEGHRLLEEGRYGAAAADLRAALVASGGSTGRCQTPTSEGCLTYAYALYDLGRALQLENHPGAAVPLLRERLRIDDQRPTVRSELNTARSQLHHGATPPGSANSTPQQGDGHEPTGGASPHRPAGTQEQARETPRSHAPAASGGEHPSGHEGARSGPAGNPAGGSEVTHSGDAAD